jgi:hypothetical protein
MRLLVRKINRSKWNNAEDDVFKLSSDAISNCLKTSRCTLSVWRINSEDEIDEAVLALVSNGSKLETIDVVTLDRDYLLKAEVSEEETAGITKVPDLVNNHLDLNELNYYKIGLVAEHIIQRIRLNKVKRYTIDELKKILQDAIQADRLKIEDLDASLAEKIK